MPALAPVNAYVDGQGHPGVVPSSAQAAFSTNVSTVVPSADVSPVVRHPPENLASSLAKHPFAGTAPPVNLSCALCTHAGSIAPVFAAFAWHLRSAFASLLTHLFLPAEQAFKTGVG